MRFSKVLLALALVGAATAELLCSDCELIAETSSMALSGEEGIQFELDVITKHVCNAVPEEMGCEENLPGFWGAIAPNLFNPDSGFFAAEHLCMDSCGNQTVVREVICHECEHVQNMELQKMSDPDIQMKVVEAFIGSEFCNQFGEDMMEQCQTGLEIVIPIAMDHLSGQLHHILHEVCVQGVGCVNNYNNNLLQRMYSIFN